MAETLKGPVIVIVGASTTGKTKLAYDFASALGATVICGDQWQLIDGFPICKSVSDIATHRRLHPEIRCELYGTLSPTSVKLTADAYAARLADVLERCDGPVVIDSLSVAYFSCLKLITGRPLLVIGRKPSWLTPIKLLWRMFQYWRAGVFEEVRLGVATYGDCWYVQESFVPQYILKYLARQWSFLGLVWNMFHTTLTGEAIRGKHARIVASACVDMWM